MQSTYGRIGQLLESKGRKIQVLGRAGSATVAYRDCYALSLVCRPDLFSADGIVVWIATSISRVVIEKRDRNRGNEAR